MEIQIPAEISLEDHDRYVLAFVAGYRCLKLTTFDDPTVIRTVREDYPEAFDAGVTAAWKRRAR